MAAHSLKYYCCYGNLDIITLTEKVNKCNITGLGKYDINDLQESILFLIDNNLHSIEMLTLLLSKVSFTTERRFIINAILLLIDKINTLKLTTSKFEEYLLLFKMTCPLANVVECCCLYVNTLSIQPEYFEIICKVFEVYTPIASITNLLRVKCDISYLEIVCNKLSGDILLSMLPDDVLPDLFKPPFSENNFKLIQYLDRFNGGYHTRVVRGACKLHSKPFFEFDSSKIPNLNKSTQKSYKFTYCTDYCISSENSCNCHVINVNSEKLHVINRLNSDGMTCIHFACLTPTYLKYILENSYLDANLRISYKNDLYTQYTGFTALHVICCSGFMNMPEGAISDKIQCIKMLLDCMQCNVHATDKKGRTALSLLGYNLHSINSFNCKLGAKDSSIISEDIIPFEIIELFLHAYHFEDLDDNFMNELNPYLRELYASQISDVYCSMQILK